MSLDGPVACLDAVTGKTIHDYPETRGAEEILLSGGLLLVLVGPGSIGDGRRSERPTEVRTIRAMRAESGESLWQASDVVTAATMATDGRQVYYFNFDLKKAVCLDRNTGNTVWKSEALPAPERQTSFFAPRLVVRDGVVLFASGEYCGMTKSGGQPQYYRWTLPLEYRLFAARKLWRPASSSKDAAARRTAGKKRRKRNSGPGGNAANYRWSTTVPIFVRAMTLAGDTLFVAGPRDVLDEKTLGRKAGGPKTAILNQEAALQGKDGAVLWGVSAKDGSRLSVFELDAPPVFDGLAAANGRLYLSTTGGQVQCLAPIDR